MDEWFLRAGGRSGVGGEGRRVKCEVSGQKLVGECEQ